MTSMATFETFIIPFIFLLAVCSLTALSKALQLLGRIRLKQEFKQKPYFYFFYSFIKYIFPKSKWDNLFYLLSFTKYLVRLLYATTFFFYLLTLIFSKLNHSTLKTPFFPTFSQLALAITIVSVLALFCEFLIRFLVTLNPPLLLKFATPISTFFIVLFSPVTFLFLKAHKIFFHKKQIPSIRGKIKDKILELVHESELSSILDPMDQRLITSIASFRERIVREIMVPRIDVFSLSVDQTVHAAAQKFIAKRYSRIPVYRNHIDQIEGVILYKDVMECYFQCIEKKETSPLEIPLENLVKPILYTPETKKISHLLQEIRKEQIHLAIVVDEYGGTEGVVTIEDILEELVGEIADEYDIIDEEKLYTPYPTGGWVVDAKMSIIDIEKELGISIPKSPEYDTLGGYIFHRAGTIPSKGWKIHVKDFDLEILSSNERSIEKIILIPCF